MAQTDDEEQGGDGVNEVQHSLRAGIHRLERLKQVQQGQARKGGHDKPTNPLSPETPDQPQGVRGNAELEEARKQSENAKTTHNITSVVLAIGVRVCPLF
jgi:hypothetical protein